MALKVVADLGTLMRLASALGKAKQNGTEEEIASYSRQTAVRATSHSSRRVRRTERLWQ